MPKRRPPAPCRRRFVLAALLPLTLIASCGDGPRAPAIDVDAADNATTESQDGDSNGQDATDATATDGLSDSPSDGTRGGKSDGESAGLAPGARCAPGSNESTADLPIATPCTDGVAEFTATRPLGFGFPDDDDLLPPHVAYLTFDDGPSDWTGDFLDILADEDVQASFFVVAKDFKGTAGLDGTYLDASGQPQVFRDVLVRTLDEGHVIGNHTVDHPDLASLTTAKAAAELDDNERLINSAFLRAGRPSRPLTLVRPPFGSPWYHHAPVPTDQEAAEAAVAGVIAARGLNVMWTIDSSDSREWAQGESFTRRPNQITPDPSAPSYADKVARIEQTVLSDPAVLAGAGAVILLHDTHNATRDALPAIIDGLRAAGYTFGTIEELAMWRWGRPSSELVPGPALYDVCTRERDWGCAGVDSADAGTSAPVCGRFWRAYERFGGASNLGLPSGPVARRADGSGPLFQPFANGVIELHPELAVPCDVLLLPP